jgi:hypothetical protein
MRGGWEGLVCCRLRADTISLWGRRFDAKVRIMSHLPSGILIGRRFLMKHAMVIDFGRLTGSFMQNVQGKPVRFSGKIMLDDCEQVEEAAVVEESDVESEIRALELSDLGDEAVNMRQVLLKHQDVFKGLGLPKGRSSNFSRLRALTSTSWTVRHADGLRRREFWGRSRFRKC